MVAFLLFLRLADIKHLCEKRTLKLVRTTQCWAPFALCCASSLTSSSSKIIKEACAARASTSQLFIQFSLLHQTTQHTPTVNFSLQRVTTTTIQLAQNYHVLGCCIGYQRYNHRCVYSVVLSNLYTFHVVL